MPFLFLLFHFGHQRAQALWLKSLHFSTGNRGSKRFDDLKPNIRNTVKP
jgi:hypothetical protein